MNRLLPFFGLVTSLFAFVVLDGAFKQEDLGLGHRDSLDGGDGLESGLELLWDVAGEDDLLGGPYVRHIKGIL